VQVVLSRLLRVELKGRFDESDALALAFHQARLLDVDARLHGAHI
jgi:hypothetical protein